jgi:hypothetical protein
MSEEGTYGGITRSGKGTFWDAPPSSGSLTLEMIQNAFESIKAMDEARAKAEHIFWKRMKPFNNLLEENDFAGYVAAYKLVRSGIYPECTLHPREFEVYTTMLTERGLWPIPVDDQT